jgi:glycosyltransferase 2 family protein
LRWAIAILILGGIGWQIGHIPAQDWQRLSVPQAAPLALATILGTVAYIWLSVAWARLRGQGETWIEVGGVWFVSLLARYLPGGIWQGAARVAGGRAAGEAAAHLLARFASEQALGCFSASILALLLLPARPMLSPILAVTLVAVALFAAMAPYLLRSWRLPRWPWPAIGWTIAAHTLAAIGFAAFVASWTPSAPETVASMARAFLVAGLAGVLAIFVPAGMGVREGVLAWLLAPTLGLAPAVAIALAARVWLLACEFAAFGLWAVITLRMRGTQQ